MCDNSEIMLLKSNGIPIDCHCKNFNCSQWEFHFPYFLQRSQFDPLHCYLGPVGGSNWDLFANQYFRKLTIETGQQQRLLRRIITRIVSKNNRKVPSDSYLWQWKNSLTPIDSHCKKLDSLILSLSFMKHSQKVSKSDFQAGESLTLTLLGMFLVWERRIKLLKFLQWEVNRSQFDLLLWIRIGVRSPVGRELSMLPSTVIIKSSRWC